MKNTILVTWKSDKCERTFQIQYDSKTGEPCTALSKSRLNNMKKIGGTWSVVGTCKVG